MHSVKRIYTLSYTIYNAGNEKERVSTMTSRFFTWVTGYIVLPFINYGNTGAERVS